jgi:hypothetical protein
MRTIILSSGILNRAGLALKNGYVSANNLSNPINYGALGSSLGSSVAPSKLNIMKGVIPADFSTLTATTSRSSDLLVSVTILGFVTQPSANIVTIDTSGNYTNAALSGTASWFWIYGSGGYWATSSAASDFSVSTQMIGTITGIGGGGDLELGVTNIVAGSPFKISNFNINLDYTSTY